jgi:hypothetical protein
VILKLRLILVIMAGHLSVRLRFESHYQNAQSNPESVKSPQQVGTAAFFSSLDNLIDDNMMSSMFNRL